MFFGIGTVVIAVIVALVISLSVVLTKKRQPPAPMLNFEIKNAVQAMVPLIKENENQVVQTLAIGLQVSDAINDNRETISINKLSWNDEWFNIAFSVARDYAMSQDVLSEAAKAKTFAQMDKSLESLDHEILVGKVDALSTTPIQTALKTLGGLAKSS